MCVKKKEYCERVSAYAHMFDAFFSLNLVFLSVSFAPVLRAPMCLNCIVQINGCELYDLHATIECQLCAISTFFSSHYAWFCGTVETATALLVLNRIHLIRIEIDAANHQMHTRANKCPFRRAHFSTTPNRSGGLFSAFAVFVFRSPINPRQFTLVLVHN